MNQRVVRIALSIPLALLTCACESSVSPTHTAAPIPVTAPAPQTPTTVSGRVWLHNEGGVELAQTARLSAWVEYPFGTTMAGPVSSDADGRYEITLPDNSTRVSVFSSLDYQPCAVRVLPGTATADVHIVKDLRLLGAHLPEEMLSQQPLLTGVAYAHTSGGRTPLPNADIRVGASLPGDGPFVASTRTDEEGRYVLCGMDLTQQRFGFWLMAGWSSSFQISPTTLLKPFDIEVQSQP